MPRLRIQGRILTLATMKVIWSRFLRRKSRGHFRQRLAEWQGLPGSLARGHVSIGETQILHAGQPFDTVSPGLMAWPITIPPSILAKTPKLSRTCRAHTGLSRALAGLTRIGLAPDLPQFSPRFPMAMSQAQAMAMRRMQPRIQGPDKNAMKHDTHVLFSVFCTGTWVPSSSQNAFLCSLSPPPINN